MLLWGEHGRGITFDEKSVDGDMAEGFADAGFAFVEEVTVEGKVSA